MAELLEDTQSLESTTVGIYRTAAVVKGGRRFSFGALVVVGDRRGNVGIGYGKAPGVPAAIEKAQKDARKKLFRVPLKEGTLPHPVTGKFGASRVRLVPASPGTGVIAGGTVRAVLEMAGVQDCLTKAYGSTNQKNLCKAVIEGLGQLRTKEQVASLRGVDLGQTEVEEKLEAGRRFRAEALGSGAEEASAAPARRAGKVGGSGAGKSEPPQQRRRSRRDQPQAQAQAQAQAPSQQESQAAPQEPQAAPQQEQAAGGESQSQPTQQESSE